MVIYEVIYTIANFELFASVTDDIQEWMLTILGYEKDPAVAEQVNQRGERRRLDGVKSPFASKSKFSTSDIKLSLGLYLLFLALMIVILLAI